MYTIDTEKLSGIEPAYTDLDKTEKEALLARVYSSAGSGEATIYTPMRKARKRKTKLWARVLIAAVVASFFLVTGLSAAGVDLNFNGSLLELFHPGSEAEKNLLQNSATDIGKSDERSGVKVEVTQVVGDRNSVYIAFEVSLDEALLRDVPEGAYFGFDLSFDDNTDSARSYSYAYAPIDTADGKVHLVLEADSHGKLSGNWVSLKLSAFKWIKDEGDDVPLVDDAWTINFKLDYKDNSVRFPDSKMTIESEETELSKIYFSPLSMAFNVSASGIVEELENNYEKYFPNWREEFPGRPEEKIGDDTPGIFGYFENHVDITIQLKDGSIYNPISDNQGMSGTYESPFFGSDFYAFIAKFDRVIDPAEVAKITIGDAVVFGG